MKINTLTKFKVKRPETINLSNNWEVSLSSITFPHIWYTIREDCNDITYDVV